MKLLLPGEENQTQAEGEGQTTISQRRGQVLNFLYVLAILLGTAVAILQAHGLPSWFLKVAIAFYSAGFLLIAWMAWPTVSTSIQHLREKRHRKVAANHLFPEFRNLVKQFKKYLNPNQPNNIPYVLRQIGQQLDLLPEYRGRLVSMDLAYLWFFFEYFEERLQGASYSFPAFAMFAREFAIIVDLYHYSFVYGPYERLRPIGLAVLPEGYAKSLGGELEFQREEYMTFLREYQQFTERCNHEIDQNFLKSYYFPLKKIE